jgi:plastocyanin
MKIMKSLRRVLMLLLALTIATAALAAKPKTPDKSDKDQAADKVSAVSIKEMKFSPASITIKPGEKVIWTNNDDHDHTVVADDNSFKSGNLSRGDSFEHKFDKTGKFKYACSYHPRMKGVVVVAQDAK